MLSRFFLTKNHLCSLLTIWAQSVKILKTQQSTVQNLLNREWLRYSGVFMAWTNYLDKTLQNISSSLKILAKFLDSWSAQALLLRRAEAGIPMVRDQGKVEVQEGHSNFDQLRNSILNIGNVCECWSNYKKNLDLKF